MTSPARLIDRIDRAFGGEKRPGKIGIAVSGGSDSLALLHLLHEWGRVPLAAATVDHGLRAEAADEARIVADHCETLGIPHQTLRWQGWDGKGNLQAQARQNRYSLLADWARSEGCEVVALGHTMDDQAETFLMRLSRASGIDALSGMDSRIWRHEQRFDRPLLDARRDDLKAYLSARGVAWIDDPSNEDDRFDRVKARKALGQLENMGLTPEKITHSMVNLSLAAMELRERAGDIALKICRETAGDLIFDRAAYRNLYPDMKFRLFTKALMYVSSEIYPPRRESLYDAEAAVFSNQNHTLHGCLIMVSEMTVRFTREFKAVETLTGPTTAPWDTRWDIDGPHAPDLEVRALGDALKDTPWRDTGIPRQSLLASPAIWRGNELIAAPLAGLSEGWTAEATGRGNFAHFVLSR